MAQNSERADPRFKPKFPRLTMLRRQRRKFDNQRRAEMLHRGPQPR